MYYNWNTKYKKGSYCKQLVNKIPVIQKNKSLKKNVSNICNELYNINNFLVKTYDDIFTKRLDNKRILKNMLRMKHKNGSRVLAKKEAYDILSNFLKMNKQTGGSSTQPINEPLTGEQLPEELEIESDKPTPDAEKTDLPKEDTIKTDVQKQDESKINELKMGDFYKGEKDPGKKDTFQVSDIEITDEQEASFKKDLLEKNFDMVEMMLICLSLFPMTGWMFDFYLIAYALIQKKYGLAIITILNWYIWGFWAVFGMNPFINLGPIFKFGYLGNQGSKIKKVFGCGKIKNDKFFKDEILQSQGITTIPKKIEHPKYGRSMNFLVDERTGFVYNSVIRNPEIIGVMKGNSGEYVWKDVDLEFDKSVRDRERTFMKNKHKGPGLKFTKPCELPKPREGASILLGERMNEQSTPENWKVIQKGIQQSKDASESKAANAKIPEPIGLPSQLSRGGNDAIKPLVNHNSKVIDNINKQF